jgi:medium-chain acyl-[acyl-carrier-protein] hydrolase
MLTHVIGKGDDRISWALRGQPRADDPVMANAQAGDDRVRWLKWFERRGARDFRLFCFHHAGGTASMYREWPQLLPECIQPVGVQLPGRADRIREPPFSAMAPLIDALIGVLAPLLGQPFAFYGLSMGARVSWALTHTLRERAMPMPSALFVASTAAPNWKERWFHRGGLMDGDLVDYLREMGGTPPEVFSEPELLASYLPTLRADLVLGGTCQIRPTTPLDVPIRAFAGVDDVDGPPERMSGWRDETSGRFQLDLLPGGHFFDRAGELRVIKAIADELAQDLGVLKERTDRDASPPSGTQ